MSTPHPAMPPLLDWLRERHQRLKELEAGAIQALYEQKDESAHRELMTQRAQLIASLDEDSAPLTRVLSDQSRELANGRLRLFSESARTSLRINSIFYMSALLYPDDHKQGEPDNMERLIAELSGG